jgi:hypothetical protein
MHPILDPWAPELLASRLAAFEKLCGSNYAQRIILVTTMWSMVDEAEALRRENKLRTIHWKSMMDLGSDMIRYENTAESAWCAVKMLLHTDHNGASRHKEHSSDEPELSGPKTLQDLSNYDVSIAWVLSSMNIIVLLTVWLGYWDPSVRVKLR